MKYLVYTHVICFFQGAKTKMYFWSTCFFGHCIGSTSAPSSIGTWRCLVLYSQTYNIQVQQKNKNMYSDHPFASCFFYGYRCPSLPNSPVIFGRKKSPGFAAKQEALYLGSGMWCWWLWSHGFGTRHQQQPHGKGRNGMIPGVCVRVHPEPLPLGERLIRGLRDSTNGR